jgi:drug/metabolite transporter (DMT)-like permease
LDRQIMLGCTACVAGLATLLTLCRPSDTGGTLRDLSRLIPLAAVLCGIIVVCLVVAVGARFSGGAHVAALALATGVVYGLTAGLTKVVTGQLRDGGLAEVFSHPTIYLIAVIGPMGFLLSQNTFQQGLLIAPALAIISIVDPLVGVAIGVFWLGEEVAMTPAVLAGEAVAAAVLAGGIVLLARRGTQIRNQFELAVREGERAGAAARWG